MTVINDTRVVRLQRTAARTGHQHSADERIVESVVKELVTAADVVALPPGSLITLQRGPGSGHTEEGSVLNATGNDIGGVAGGQTTSVSFNSEDGDVTANAIFQVEIDFSQTLSNPGEYAVNYKTFQIKTYTVVPTTPGQRVQVTYTWAPIREYLEWDPEDLTPDLVAFGVGPHQSGGDDGVDLLEGCHINLSESDGYTTVSVDLTDMAGDGLRVIEGTDGYCGKLAVDFAGQVNAINKLGSDAEDPNYRSIFSLDGYTYPLNEDRLLVFVNGLMQFTPRNYTESSISTITLTTPADPDDEIDILILPGSLGGGNGTGTTDLQIAYDNSLSGNKTIDLDDGQITLNQTLGTGSALRLVSANVTTALHIDQSGSGEAARLKTVHGTNPTLLLQKDTVSRNTIVNTTIIERTTSHAIGALVGIGSAILTRLENTGGNLFPASRIVTGTEDATDASEKTYMSFELSDDGIFTEHARFTSVGRFGLGTISPSKTIHIEGDGYMSQDFEVANKIIAGSNTGRAPLNVPVFNADPGDLDHGDIWITDIGGTRKMNVRISGITYSVEVT
jgi:hypothetical protein